MTHVLRLALAHRLRSDLYRVEFRRPGGLGWHVCYAVHFEKRRPPMLRKRGGRVKGREILR